MEKYGRIAVNFGYVAKGINTKTRNLSPFLLQPHYTVIFPVSIDEMQLSDEVTDIETESPEHV